MLSQIAATMTMMTMMTLKISAKRLISNSQPRTTTNHTPQTQFLLFLQFLLHLSLKTRQFVIPILSSGLHITYFEPKPSLFGPLSFSKTHKHTKFFVSIYVEDTDDDDKEARNNDAGKFLLAVIIIGIS